MMISPDIAEWFDYGEADLRLAETILSDERWLRHVCFLSQQAVEKCLKGFLIHSGVAPLRTHVLEHLVGRCVLLDATFQEWESKLDVLSDYAVAPRYPGARISRENAQYAVELARQTLLFVEGKLRSDTDDEERENGSGD